MRKKQEGVTFVYDPRDYRRHLRMQEQAAARKAQRVFMFQECAYTILFFIALVWASGIIH